jgi:hypothetical protein
LLQVLVVVQQYILFVFHLPQGLLFLFQLVSQRYHLVFHLLVVQLVLLFDLVALLQLL